LAHVFVILAAGKGIRMKSHLPKVLHPVAGRPMLAYLLDTVAQVGSDGVYVVVGHQADRVKEVFAEAGVKFVHQREQLGTGHAVMQCQETLEDFKGTVVVLNGDVPCLLPRTVRSFIDHHRGSGCAATVMTALMENPTGYGRIVKDGRGRVERIVEEKDADESHRIIKEVNAGLFCFEKDPLFSALRRVGRDNAQGEYYLTDVVEVLRGAGLEVGAYLVEDAREVTAVNTLEELRRVERYLERERQ